MKPFLLIFIFGTILFFTSCENQDQNKLDIIEDNLPGTWIIDEVEIDVLFSDLTYNGEPVTSGTVIEDYGTISIPSFLISSVEDRNDAGVILTYINSGNRNELVYIDRISINPSDSDNYFTTFKIPNLDLSEELGVFLQATKFFTLNSTIRFINENEIEMKLSSYDNYMRLIRK